MSTENNNSMDCENTGLSHASIETNTNMATAHGNQPATINSGGKTSIITLEVIWEKLERIEGKLDNINLRVEALEERIGSVENDQEHCFGDVDVLKAEIDDMKKKIDKLDSTASRQKQQPGTSNTMMQVTLDKRLEVMENEQRSSNFKIINLPEELNEDLPLKVKNILNFLGQNRPNAQAQDVQAVCTVLTVQRLGRQEGAEPHIKNRQADGQTGGARARPVLVKCTDNNTVKSLLKYANKALKNRPFNNTRARLVDDVCVYTQQQRRALLPKMHSLRQDGLLALIPFTNTAKRIYKQGNTWNTILPQNV